MRDENGKLCMSFELQDKLVKAVLHMSLLSLEEVAKALNYDDFIRVHRNYCSGILSMCVYRAFLALIIYDDPFMRGIFDFED